VIRQPAPAALVDRRSTLLPVCAAFPAQDPHRSQSAQSCCFQSFVPEKTRRPMPLTVGKMLTKVFGSRNERLLKRYHKIVDLINDLEPQIQSMTDPELRARTQELRQGVQAGKLDARDILPEAFAIIRESMDRHIGIRSIFDPENHFDPDQFQDDMLEAYDQVQQQMIATGQSWQRIPIPPEI
jgi:hypothetical protein